MANGIYTILLLILSNVFMTFAWYGHLKLQQSGVSTNWPLYLVIAFSWMIAFFEYCCQVPANRLGFIDNGGPFSLVQLKVIQECISLVVFAVIANMIFQHEQLHWNHAAAALCLVAAVYFVFMKPCAEQHRQHAGGVRVESAGMADLFCTQSLSNDGNYVEGGIALLLIYQDDAVHRYSSAALIRMDFTSSNSFMPSEPGMVLPASSYSAPS